jgi:hypothetical protein
VLLQKGLRRLGGNPNDLPSSVLETAKQNLPQYPLAAGKGAAYT